MASSTVSICVTSCTLAPVRLKPHVPGVRQGSVLLDIRSASAYIVHMSLIVGSKEFEVETVNVIEAHRTTSAAAKTRKIAVKNGVLKDFTGEGPVKRKRVITAEKWRSSVFAKMYKASALERIEIARRGVAAEMFVLTGTEMGVPKEKLFTLLHVPRATINRRIQRNEALPPEYSERIIGLQKLIGQVEVMVAESGDPTGFNAAHWVADWLERPQPALNNAKPAEFMDTIEGQELVSSLIAKMQSGAYA